ncbi:hypothetical protein GPJ61_22240 [Brevibacillus formosus]|nr:hypothetical protein [Brevibacillus formosus]
MSQHSGGEEKAQFSSTLTRQHGGITGRLHLRKPLPRQFQGGATAFKRKVFMRSGIYMINSYTFKKGTVEPKPPYGRKLLKEEVFDKRGPLFAVPTG